MDDQHQSRLSETDGEEGETVLNMGLHIVASADFWCNRKHSYQHHRREQVEQVSVASLKDIEGLRCINDFNKSEAKDYIIGDTQAYEKVHKLT